MELTASKAPIYASRFCGRASMLRRRSLAGADCVSRRMVRQSPSFLRMRGRTRFILAVALWVMYAQPAAAQESRRRELPKRVERGSGIILVDVEPKSGRVTGARMLKSTGNRTLDDAAIKRFLKQRFKAGTPRRFQVPISYEMTFDD